jgi:hypothetical protein
MSLLNILRAAIRWQICSGRCQDASLKIEELNDKAKKVCGNLHYGRTLDKSKYPVSTTS